MIKAYFMRTDKRQKRGYIADVPNNKPCQYVKPFIIVQFDNTQPEYVEQLEEILTDNTVRLKLDQLIARYPDTTEEYTDEAGSTQERIVYGYFSEFGTSVTDGCPVITMDDIERDEVINE